MRAFRLRYVAWTAAACYIAACLVLDLFPQYGPPHFRYTGSDPDVPVWNLGWPLAEFIYDPRHGLQVGPGAPLLIAAQCGVFVFCVALVVVANWNRDRRSL